MYSSPKTVELLVKNWSGLDVLIAKLKSNIKKCNEFYKAYKPEENDDKHFVSVLYSNSLFEDATDNIFYKMELVKTMDGVTGREFDTSFRANITLVHNANNQVVTFSLLPTKHFIQGTEQEYYLETSYNSSFPTTYTHLLYDALKKLSNELNSGGNYETLDNVAILYDTEKYHGKK